MNRVVITGGPSTGKTSLIEEFKKLGYVTFSEVARKIIQQQLDMGTKKLPWDDVSGFSKLVLNEQLNDFNSADSNLTLYDRGIPDIIGYLNHANKKIFKKLIDSNRINRYNKVFILPPWKEIYKNDNERRESFKEANFIHDEIEQAYLKSGYNPIKVPFGSIQNRINFILNLLDE
ncbi:MAG: hypothetical protein CMP67_01415 [Flavobacteriales bacterium]|nr:hypothetical protein [Flavobacteriales bacterium]MBO73555.1 hypothetical protein [Flavobacteriales bacterium]|tara:strand:- start:337 stop:861 length:525 start_codon:yes stop_codon:yes gene_type:complete